MTSSSRHALQFLIEGISLQDAARPPSETGPHTFGGPHHLQGFSPPPSEGNIISTAYPHALLAGLLLLLGNFYSVFAISTLDVQPHSWQRTESVCIIHLYPVFAPPPPPFSSCPPPHPFPLAFYPCVFLFSLIYAFLCAVYSEGYSLVATYFPLRGPSVSS